MATREWGRDRSRRGGEKEGDLGMRGAGGGWEGEKGETGTILATITINKPDSLSEVESQMCVCVCFPSGHVTCGKEAVFLR